MASGVLYQRDDEDGDADAWDDTMLIKAYDNAVSAMQAKLAAQHPEYSVPNAPTTKKKKKTKQKPRNKKSNKPKAIQKWKAGDFCLAQYSEDGHIYSAQIVSIDNNEGTCVVKYIGYGNEEEQILDSLLPTLNEPSSQDNKTDTASEVESTSDVPTDKQSSRRKPNRGASGPSWRWNNFAVPPPPPVSSRHPFHGYPAPPPPPPSGFGPAAPYLHMFPGIPPPPPMFNNHDDGTENEAMYSMLISWYMSGYHTGYYQGMKSGKSSSMFPGPHR